ncbi:DUF5629 family protein [Pseudomonas akapageensis]|uniref:DUF5629 family protein n=1 Tax=Pseudomonas akapageensis TaxID=2609961 RepID=UPI00140A561B|nr:DUF5629 family protein [Pseudomonas akapageensis]
MTGTTDSLLDVLDACDMLLIDGLHAFDFTQPEEGGLRIESMDGRDMKRWFFTPAEIEAATFDATQQAWLINAANGNHQLVCMSAFSASDDDSEEE